MYAQLRPQVTPPPKKAPAKKKPAQPQPEKPPEAKPTQIVVETSPGAQVYLDDTFKGQASPQGRLVIDNPKPGDHRLRVSLAGKKDYEHQVTVVGGQVGRVQAALADLAGSIRVQTSAGAEVFLDNSSRGTPGQSGQLVIPEVAGGAHDLRVSAPGKKDYRQSVTVAAGQEIRVEAALAEVENPAPDLGKSRRTPKTDSSTCGFRRGLSRWAVRQEIASATNGRSPHIR